MPQDRHRVVIVGGGFGGLYAARPLRRAPVDLTVIDRRNFHTFQPLLYQVATGSLSPGEIAQPLRRIVRPRHGRVLMADVTGFDLVARRVHLADRRSVPYDTLVVAAGARHSYFGHPEWEELAPGLKTIEDAIEIRRRVLSAFEELELAPDQAARDALLTFVVIGGGPTGVELAGQIAEIAHDTLRRDFHGFDPADARVILLDAGDRVLAAFDPRLSRRAARSLARLGVEVRTGALVTGVTAEAVTVRTGEREEAIPARTAVWAAGVAASPLARALGRASESPVDRAGRVTVEPDLTLAGHPEVFAIGDMVAVRRPEGSGIQELPGVAPTAMQEGRYVARAIRRRAAGRPPPGPFRYRDKGSLATIGRNAAVADLKGLRFGGFVAWTLWLTIHIFYLIGFQNRLLVFIRWAWSYLTRGRGARLITGRWPVE